MTANALGRTTAFVVLRWIVIATIPLTGCYRAPSARTFSGAACPAGWRFIYSDHLRHGVVCDRDTTNTTAWHFIAPSQSK
jgi:hypothetical protein